MNGSSTVARRDKSSGLVGMDGEETSARRFDYVPPPPHPPAAGSVRRPFGNYCQPTVDGRFWFVQRYDDIYVRSDKVQKKNPIHGWQWQMQR